MYRRSPRWRSGDCQIPKDAYLLAGVEHIDQDGAIAEVAEILRPGVLHRLLEYGESLRTRGRGIARCGYHNRARAADYLEAARIDALAGNRISDGHAEGLLDLHLG